MVLNYIKGGLTGLGRAWWGRVGLGQAEQAGRVERSMNWLSLARQNWAGADSTGQSKAWWCCAEPVWARSGQGRSHQNWTELSRTG